MNKRPNRPFVILLVEDEPADAYLIKVALRQTRTQIELHWVNDGVEGFEFLRRESDDFRAVPHPDLILLDLNMPRMDGREFLTAIKQDPKFCDIPVIMLTTSDVERDVLISYQLGAAGYIVKPIELAELAAAVKGLEHYWFGVVRLPEIGR
ncbi:MAG: response regulator [Candidatus Contendobacter sp.]|nr:response regulator [Candidatus Contendobacter sp.]